MPKSSQRASKSINMPHSGIISPSPNSSLGIGLRQVQVTSLDHKDLSDPNNVFVNQFNS